jgi:hypothetical protein
MGAAIESDTCVEFRDDVGTKHPPDTIARVFAGSREHAVA